MLITNVEYKRLIQMKKYFIPGYPELPLENQKAFYKLKGESEEEFQLNIERKHVLELNKTKIHHSYFKEPIIRLEIDAPPHQNPDLTVTGRNHMHIYREGMALQWAYDLDKFPGLFLHLNDFNLIFNDFCVYCNIVVEPQIALIEGGDPNA